MRSSTRAQLLSAATVAIVGLTVVTAAPAQAAPPTTGIDIGGSQARLRWTSVNPAVVQWAYIKATEGSTWRSPYFAAQYNGAYRRGLIRGAYHYARPDGQSGASQATTFVHHGGGWSDDGRTLPGALDLEGSTTHGRCFGRTPGQMVAWIADFVGRYWTMVRRAAIIYTSPYWWRVCTGNSTRFAATNPLWIAHWAAAIGPLPGGWRRHTMWQYTNKGRLDGIQVDLNRFNGTYAQLKTFTHHR
jgi:GH25 family lysozyme M1 (1,4-beta-N-acetylmuramidase)